MREARDSSYAGLERGSLRRRDAAGFSLIEILLATVLLGVGMVALTAGITASLRTGKEAERKTMAALVGASQMESLRAEGYWVQGEDEGLDESGLYRWHQAITETPIEGLYEATIDVTLDATEEQLVELQTLLFDPPVYSTADEAEWSRTENAAGKSKGTRP